MPTPLPSPILPKAAPIIQARRMGEQDQIARQQRGALQRAGTMAAEGSLSGARKHLLRKGLMDEANQFQQLMEQRSQHGREQAQRLFQTVGRLAGSIKSPEQWEQVKPILREQGLDVDRYSFEDLPMVAQTYQGLAEPGDLMRVGDNIYDPNTQSWVTPPGGGMSPIQEERLKARAKARGRMEGEEVAQRPQTVAKAERMLGSIDAALRDPATFQVTGPIGGRLPNVTGTAARGQSRIDQIRGQTFLQAYQDLKGGGQITEIEGQKAEDALSRLNTQGMSDEDYRQALIDLREVVTKGLQRARGQNVEGDDLPAPATPEEAAKLPPGTAFKTPDGRIKVRP